MKENHLPHKEMIDYHFFPFGFVRIESGLTNSSYLIIITNSVSLIVSSFKPQTGFLFYSYS